jgi:cytochrome P450
MQIADLPEIDVESPELVRSVESADASVAAIRDEVGFARSQRGVEVLNYAGVEEVMRDTRFTNGIEVKLRESGIDAGPTFEAITGLITSMEGERHSRCRRPAASFFNRSAAEKLRADVRTWVVDWLDEQRDADEFDFAEVIGARLPASVFCSIIGVPLTDAPYVARISSDILLITKVFGPENGEIISGACADGMEYLRSRIRHKREHPGTDLISVMLEAQREGTVDDDDIMGVLLAVLIGSTDTTNAQMCLNLVTLAAHPDQWQLLKSRPELVDTAVTELLRFNPGLWTHFRTSLEDTTFRDLEVSPADSLFVCAYSANRDPMVFEDPGKLDLERRLKRPPANFGAGRHSCIGQVVSLVEQQEALRAVVERWADYEIVDAGFSGAQYAVFPDKLVVRCG